MLFDHRNVQKYLANAGYFLSMLVIMTIVMQGRQLPLQ